MPPVAAPSTSVPYFYRQFRNILGGNAVRLFNLKRPAEKLARVA